jgi:aminoglycoside/choline kinase family phosphotransferase
MDTPPALDLRAVAARDWAAGRIAMPVARFEPASADASFRRYFRLTDVGGRTLIVMDAPPQYEDCRPFVSIAAQMRAAGLHVPEVLASDLDQGFLLLSDLGRQTFLDVLEPHNADALFEAAVDALLLWQRASRPGELPAYDAALLQREMALFPEWYLGRHLAVRLSKAENEALDEVRLALVERALAQPQVYVHRDYMPRNLMLSAPNPGVLDFQDAVEGPLAYDVISLFRDAFMSWPSERVDGWLRLYHQRASDAGLPVPPLETFLVDCDWIGLQRHLKILGIFARLTYRDGKPKYLADTPRFVAYVMAVAPRYPQLQPLTEIFERHVLPRLADHRA